MSAHRPGLRAWIGNAADRIGARDGRRERDGGRSDARPAMLLAGCVILASLLILDAGVHAYLVGFEPLPATTMLLAVGAVMLVHRLPATGAVAVILIDAAAVWLPVAFKTSFLQVAVLAALVVLGARRPWLAVAAVAIRVINAPLHALTMTGALPYWADDPLAMANMYGSGVLFDLMVVLIGVLLARAGRARRLRDELDRARERELVADRLHDRICNDLSLLVLHLDGRLGERPEGRPDGDDAGNTAVYGAEGGADSPAADEHCEADSADANEHCGIGDGTADDPERRELIWLRDELSATLAQTREVIVVLRGGHGDGRPPLDSRSSSIHASGDGASAQRDGTFDALGPSVPGGVSGASAQRDGAFDSCRPTVPASGDGRTALPYDGAGQAAMIGRQVGEWQRRLERFGLRGEIMIGRPTPKAMDRERFMLVTGLIDELFGDIGRYADRTVGYTFAIGWTAAAFTLSAADKPRPELAIASRAPVGTGTGLARYATAVRQAGGDWRLTCTHDEWSLSIRLPAAS